jgi:hypothetical protein
MNPDVAYLEILKTVTREVIKKTDISELTSSVYNTVEEIEVKTMTDLITTITYNLYSSYNQL